MRCKIWRIGDRPGRHRFHPEDLPQIGLVRSIADPQQPSPGQVPDGSMHLAGLAELMKADYEKRTTVIKASGIPPE